MIVESRPWNGFGLSCGDEDRPGWTGLSVEKSRGTNPDTEESFIIFAHTSRRKVFAYEPYLLISQVITKEGDEGFSEDEVFSLESVEYCDSQKCGGYGPVKVRMKTGCTYTVDFDGIEGRLLM